MLKSRIFGFVPGWLALILVLGGTAAGAAVVPNFNGSVTVPTGGSVTINSGLFTASVATNSNPSDDFLAQYFDTYAAGAGTFATPITLLEYMRNGGTGSRQTVFDRFVSGYGASGQFFVPLQLLGESCGTSADSYCSASDQGGGSGNFFGLGAEVRILAGTPSSAEAVGAEFDTNVQATVTRKVGLQLVDLSTSTASGSAVDSALLIDSQTNAVRYDDGILFGYLNAGVKTTGTLIKSGAYSYANGVDLSLSTISGSAFKSSGFTVDGSGNVTGASINAQTGVSGGYKLGGNSIITGDGTNVVFRPNASTGIYAFQNFGGGAEWAHINSTGVVSDGILGGTSVNDSGLTASSALCSDGSKNLSSSCTSIAPAFGQNVCSATSGNPCSFTWSVTMAAGSGTATHAAPAGSVCTVNPSTSPVLSTTNAAFAWPTIASTTVTVNVHDMLASSTATITGNATCL